MPSLKNKIKALIFIHILIFFLEILPYAEHSVSCVYWHGNNYFLNDVRHIFAEVLQCYEHISN